MIAESQNPPRVTAGKLIQVNFQAFLQVSKYFSVNTFLKILF